MLNMRILHFFVVDKAGKHSIPSCTTLSNYTGEVLGHFARLFPLKASTGLFMLTRQKAADFTALEAMFERL